MSDHFGSDIRRMFTESKGVIMENQVMRPYIGHEIKFVIEGFRLTGILTSEDSVFLYIKNKENEEIWRVPKGKLVGFTPMDFEPKKYVPFHVLYCENKSISCDGVQFIKEGSGFNPDDFNVFMEGCPCKSETCKMGTKGELRTVSGDVLKKMFVGILFGDYPEKEEKHAGRGQSTGKTKSGEIEGGADIGTEEPTDGGTGQPEEKAGGTGEEM